MAASLWRVVTGMSEDPPDYDSVEFWSNPERTGWLTKQGEYIKTWRCRWFILKQGKLFWFKDSAVTRASRPRGVGTSCIIDVGTPSEGTSIGCRWITGDAHHRNPRRPPHAAPP